MVSLSMSFTGRRILLHKNLIESLDKPEYLRFYVDEESKQLFLQGTDQPKDAYHLYYQNRSGDYVNSTPLMKYLAKVIGVGYPSASLRFQGQMLEDNQTAFFNLSDYTTLSSEKDLSE